MRAFVTGATGFIGSSVVRVLLDAGCEVHALVRPGSDDRAIAGLPVERIPGDVRDPRGLRTAMRGCNHVYHLAAAYACWTPDPAEIYATNVHGTRHVLAAAAAEGVERVVCTGSVCTLGCRANGVPRTEQDAASLSDMVGDYERSRFMAEEIAREFYRRGLPVVIVTPSTPVGVRDVKPTPTGRVILDFLTGHLPILAYSGLNLVDVEDVALGYWLAARSGRPGQRYILGGHNMAAREILDSLAEIAGRPPPRVRLPPCLATLLARADALCARLSRSYTPHSTPASGRFLHKPIFCDPSRAVLELGLPLNDPRQALEKAVAWFQNGFNGSSKGE